VNGPNPLSIIDAAAEAPDHPAVIVAGDTITYADLATQVDAHPTDAELEIVVGHPSLDAMIAVLAAFARRRPLLLLHPRHTDAERAALTTRAQACLQSNVAPAVFIPTSGTTGQPKLVRLSTKALVAAADASAGNLGWHSDDRWLLNLTVGHVGGLSVITRCLLARKTVVLGSRFDAVALLEQINRDRVTLLSLVPTMLARVLDAGLHAPASVRAVLVGGAPSSAALLDRARGRGWPALRTYGLTEASAQVATQSPAGGDDGSGSPLQGVQVRLRDGIIELAGATLFDGYDDLDHRGWFRTNDRGFIDDAGNLHVLGRADDLIITGGENVDPAEVEAALESIDGVGEAAVVGVDDPDWGQCVVALLVLEDGGAVTGHEAELQSLAAFKRPKRYVSVDALPRSAMGKLDRGALASLA